MQVSFVIPIYNQVSHTQRCLAALDQHVPTSIAHEIILVNDGSDDATRDYLNSLSASIRVEHLPENLGFAGATNRGAELAQGRWLCLLNNDVEITAGALTAMLDVPIAHPDAGVIGNIQVTTDGGEVDHAGIFFIDGGYPVHRKPTIEALSIAPDSETAAAVTAACCLVDRAWFISVNGLDVGYQNGFEDVDLCLRAREAGWGIYVANRSIVRHAVSASEGRGRFEYRNARRFLQRWGPRTAALEQSAERQSAEAYRSKRSTETRGKPEPTEVRRAREHAREQTRQRELLNETPAMVWVDLLRMEPKGANGGIKPLVYGLLREMEQLKWKPLRFIILAQSGLREELNDLGKSCLVITRDQAKWQTHPQDADGPSLSQSELESRHPPDVLYCPFGTSEFMRPGLPSISLLVDALHRDLPAALPIEEVNYREDNFKRIIGAATWIQALAQHGIERLGYHYDLHPTRCFHTYAAVHGRLDERSTKITRSDALPDGPFFFYPANFWSHKNHEVLLTAYRLYRSTTKEKPWELLLTGHPDGRMQMLQKLSQSLGLAGKVHFAGHLPHDAFVAVWQQAGALVFPSLHEGFGIPLVEAFHAGLPVAASAVSVLPEVGGDACAWFDPRDPAAVAATLVTLAEDSALRDDLRAKGKSRLSRFSLHYEASRLNHFLYAAARNLVP